MSSCIARIAPATAMLVNAVTFIASAVAVWSIGSGPAFVPSGKAGETVGGVLDGIVAGAQGLRALPAAIRLIAADVVCSAVYGTLTVLFVLLGRQLGAGNGAYGLLMGAYGIGGVARAGRPRIGRFADRENRAWPGAPAASARAGLSRSRYSRYGNSSSSVAWSSSTRAPLVAAEQAPSRSRSPMPAPGGTVRSMIPPRRADAGGSCRW